MKAPVTIEKARDGVHKYVAVVHGDPATARVPFGAVGYSDYTLHHDKARRQRYIIRHRKREDWTKSGRLSAGFYSLHLLWGPTTSLQKNTEIMLKKFWPTRGKRPDVGPGR